MFNMERFFMDPPVFSLISMSLPLILYIPLTNGRGEFLIATVTPADFFISGFCPSFTVLVSFRPKNIAYSLFSSLSVLSLCVSCMRDISIYLCS